jgi:flagellar biosynthesis chaperone FliJ
MRELKAKLKTLATVHALWGRELASAQARWKGVSDHRARLEAQLLALKDHQTYYQDNRRKKQGVLQPPALVSNASSFEGLLQETETTLQDELERTTPAWEAAREAWLQWTTKVKELERRQAETRAELDSLQEKSDQSRRDEWFNLRQRMRG